MPNKMERFTQRARRVLSHAQEVAQQYQHSRIGLGHLFLGLAREKGGVASRALRNLEIDLPRAEAIMLQAEAHTLKRDDAQQLDLSAEVKRSLELAVDEARRLGHHYIGTEHLLLGCLRMTGSALIKTLHDTDVDPQAIREQVRHILMEKLTPSKTEEDDTRRVILFRVMDAATGEEQATFSLSASQIAALNSLVEHMTTYTSSVQQKFTIEVNDQIIEIVTKPYNVNDDDM